MTRSCKRTGQTPTTARETGGNGTAKMAVPGAARPVGLLRFDNIFGTGPGKIPVGSTITSAVLTLAVFRRE